MGCEACKNNYDKCTKKDEETEAKSTDQESYISFSQISHPINEYDIYPTIETKYFFEKSYGSGLFGSSMQIKDKNNKNVFMLKILPKSSLIDYGKAIEAYTLYEHIKEIKFEFLNPIIEIFENEENIFLVSPLSNLGNINQYILLRDTKKKPLNLIEIRYILTCVVKGLQVLAKHKIPHGNLCKENILLFPIEGVNKFRIKLDDFGHCLNFVSQKNEFNKRYYKYDLISLTKLIEELNQDGKYSEFTIIKQYLDNELEKNDLESSIVYEKVIKMLNDIKKD